MPRFPATRWSVVQRARGRDDAASRAALGELCRGYWPPLYAWARRQGHDPDAAAELIQGFFAALLGGDSLQGFDRERGRFRSWLLGALRHHASRGRERERAAKRGGDATVIPFDAELAERVHGAVASAPDPEQAYARAWALGVLARVEAKLRADYRARGAEAELDALAPVILHDADVRYAAIAATLGRSEGAIKVAAHRLRKRWGELLRAEVADTVATADEVEPELRALIAAVRADDRL